jgi:hypothetical protein
MKRVVHIFSLICTLSVLPGCATKAAGNTTNYVVITTSYDELILKDITWILTWIESGRYFVYAAGRSFRVASAFLKNYPDETKAVVEFLRETRELLLDTENIYSAVEIYTQAHSDYIVDKTEAFGEILYQALSDTIAYVQRWTYKRKAWDMSLIIFELRMDDAGFDSSTVQ